MFGNSFWKKTVLSNRYCLASYTVPVSLQSDHAPLRGSLEECRLERLIATSCDVEIRQIVKYTMHKCTHCNHCTWRNWCSRAHSHLSSFTHRCGRARSCASDGRRPRGTENRQFVIVTTSSRHESSILPIIFHKHILFNALQTSCVANNSAYHRTKNNVQVGNGKSIISLLPYREVSVGTVDDVVQETALLLERLKIEKVIAESWRFFQYL